MEIYTIGFTRKSAAEFFGTLKDADVKQLVDVRLNNVSQLAGFTKRDDLEFFLRELCDAAYHHEPLSPATIMGPLRGVFCHEHGTTWLPVMGPPGVLCRGC